MGAGVVVLPNIVGATPAPPTIAQVTAKLDKLAKQNEVLAEQFNKATAEVQADQKAADAAQRAALTAAGSFETARIRLRQTVTAEYESSSFSHAGALLTSQDGQSYIDALNTMSLVSSHRAEIVTQIKAVHTKALDSQAKAAKLLSAAQEKAAALDKQKNKIEAETAKFKKLLDTLNAAQQRAYAQRNTVSPTDARKQIKEAPKPPPGSGKASSAQAQAAVTYAIAQVGKGYVFAGTGPDQFDCSGLTMMAWAQGGVSLPHQASEQYNLGTHVSASDLQPGDLVFLYSPISHVEIMVGPDLAVSAADEALGVRYVHPSADMSDFAGATRLT
jgi:cell wall-associated NlpC family hydrolase